MAYFEGQIDQNNTIAGTGDADSIVGGSREDRLFGYGGDDYITGGDGHDVVVGGSGNDWLQGDFGDDNLYGESGVDSLYGGAGDDKLYAGDNNDFLIGGDGDDRCYGGAGNDAIVSEGLKSDFDWYSGENGGDSYIIQPDSGQVQIVDNGSGGEDVINFTGSTVNELFFVRVNNINGQLSVDWASGSDLYIYTSQDAADGSIDQPVLISGQYSSSANHIETLIDSYGDHYSF